MQSILELFKLEVDYSSISAKVQGCIGVTYTATQSTLELFKLEVDYSSTLFQQKCKIAQESLIQQLNQYWDYLSQKSIIHHFVQQKYKISYFNSKSARLHRSRLYSNSINTGTISSFSRSHRSHYSSTLELFVSAKVQDCIGVTYTATQSTLGLFKLEVDYSSTLFQQKCKIAQESLIQQLNQHWDYLSQKLIIHQLHFSKSARLHRSHLYSNSINTGTIQARSQLFINFVSAKVQDCIGVALIQQLQSILELFKLEVN